MRVLNSTKAVAFVMVFLSTLLAGAAAARADDAATVSVPVGAAAAIAAMTPATTAPVDDGDPYSGKLRISVTPYIWLPTINSTFRYSLSQFTRPDGSPIVPDGSTFDSTIGPNAYLAKINAALMFYGTIRKGNLALYTDLINVNISGASGQTRDFTGPFGGHTISVGTGSNSQIVTTLWTVGPSYTVFHTKTSSLDVLVGGQFLSLSANAGFSLTDNTSGTTYSAATSAKQNYSEFVAGIYGKIGLGDKWSLPYLVDGGFGTPSSWQFEGGVRYGKTELGWRYLQLNAAGSSALLQRLTLGGPMLGYTLQF